MNTMFERAKAYLPNSVTISDKPGAQLVACIKDGRLLLLIESEMSMASVLMEELTGVTNSKRYTGRQH